MKIQVGDTPPRDRQKKIYGVTKQSYYLLTGDCLLLNSLIACSFSYYLVTNNVALPSTTTAALLLDTKVVEIISLVFALCCGWLGRYLG